MLSTYLRKAAQAQAAAGMGIQGGSALLNALKAPGRAINPYVEKPLNDLAQQVPVFSPTNWIGHRTGLLEPDAEITQLRIKPVETQRGSAVERADTYVNPSVLESTGLIALVALTKGRAAKYLKKYPRFDWLTRPRNLTMGLPGTKAISRITGNPELTAAGKAIDATASGAIKYGAPSAAAITGYTAMGLDKPEGKGANVGKLLEKDRENEAVMKTSLEEKRKLIDKDRQTALMAQMAMGGLAGSVAAPLLMKRNKLLWSVAGGVVGASLPYLIDRMAGIYGAMEKKGGLGEYLARQHEGLKGAGVYDWIGQHKYGLGAGLSAGAAAAMGIKGVSAKKNRGRWLAGSGAAAALAAALAYRQSTQPDTGPSLKDIYRAGGRYTDYARMAKNINALAGLSGANLTPIREQEIKALYGTMKGKGPRSEEMKQALADVLMRHRAQGSTYAVEDMKGLLDQAFNVEDPSLDQLPEIVAGITSKSIKDTRSQLDSVKDEAKRLKTDKPIDQEQLDAFRASIKKNPQEGVPTLKPVRQEGKVE